MNDRGRRVGASHPKAKLTQEQVNRIRDLHEDERLGYRRIARMFGLHRSTVVQICSYTRWQTPTSFRKVVVQSETAVKQASNQYETERGGPLHCKPVAENGKSDG